MASNDTIKNLFVAARYSRIDCTFDIIRNSYGAGSIFQPAVLTNTGYDTALNIPTAFLATSSDPAAGIIAANWLLGESTSADSVGYRFTSGIYVQEAAGGTLGASVGWNDFAQIDDSSPTSTVIGRTVVTGTASSFAEGKAHLMNFGASSFNFF